MALSCRKTLAILGGGTLFAANADINAQPDGTSVGGPFFESLALLEMLSREAASDLESQGTKGATEGTRSAISAAEFGGNWRRAVAAPC